MATQVFIVVATSNAQAVGSAIGSLDRPFHQIRPDTWLVSFDGTSQQLATRIGVWEGTTGPAFVGLLAGYSGRAPNSVWEWMKVNWTNG
jgi:hypothetical protein